MVQQHKKSAKLMWTQAWRRLNKKGKEEGVARKKKTKKTRVTRAIGAVSIDSLAKIKKENKPKSEAQAEALKAAKEAQKAKAKKGGDFGGVKQKVVVPKHQGSAQNARGGAKR